MEICICVWVAIFALTLLSYSQPKIYLCPGTPCPDITTRCVEEPEDLPSFCNELKCPEYRCLPFNSSNPCQTCFDVEKCDKENPTQWKSYCILRTCDDFPCPQNTECEIFAKEGEIGVCWSAPCIPYDCWRRPVSLCENKNCSAEEKCIVETEKCESGRCPKFGRCVPRNCLDKPCPEDTKCFAYDGGNGEGAYKCLEPPCPPYRCVPRNKKPSAKCGQQNGNAESKT